MLKGAISANHPIKAMAVKGRNNYICKRRLYDATLMGELLFGNTGELKAIASWAKKSATGCKSELDTVPSALVWMSVNSETDSCAGKDCSYFENCFVTKMKREAEAALILVVNHHLLFSDIESRLNSHIYDKTSVLPPYTRIIFDEAHTIDDAATSFFSCETNNVRLGSLTASLFKKTKLGYNGLLAEIIRISSKADEVAQSYKMAQKLANTVDRTIEALDVESFLIMEKENTARLCEKTADKFGKWLLRCKKLEVAINQFSLYIRETISALNSDDKELSCVWDARAAIRKLDEAEELFKDFGDWEENANDVFWFSKVLRRVNKTGEGDKLFVNYTRTPQDISDLMNEGVYSVMDSVMFLSATLKVGRDFDYWLKKVGLDKAQKKVMTGEYPSPFPYDKNMIFAVPKDAPFPNEQSYTAWVGKAVTKLIKASVGRALILFTSYDMLNKTFLDAEERLASSSIKLLKQGSDSNTHLLKVFKEDIGSVLFATSSFWQGIDIKGESLSMVVIVKLPFAVPTDPIMMALCEKIEAAGGNPFSALSIPDAIAKFRQGVGRLIRGNEDFGAVVVLDKRIYEKQYGHIFLNTVPRCKLLYEELDDIAKKMREFLKEKREERGIE